MEMQKQYESKSLPHQSPKSYTVLPVTKYFLFVLCKFVYSTDEVEQGPPREINASSYDTE